MLSNRRNCFISYPWKNRNAERVIQTAIQPVLKELDWEVFDPGFSEVEVGTYIYDVIVKRIKNADLFICDVTYSDPNVIYELGLAHAWGINTIILAEAIETVPFDIASRYQLLLYSTNSVQLETTRNTFYKLLSSFEERRPSLLATSFKRYLDLERTISIELFSKDLDAIEAIKFIYGALECLSGIEKIENSFFKEVRTGSLGAWISTNLQTITNLIEKLIFIVPEWKKHNAERVKLEAEAGLTRAKAEKCNAEAHAIRGETFRRNAEKLFDLLQRGKQIGPARLTLGDKIRIEVDADGIISIGAPIKPDDDIKHA